MVKKARSKSTKPTRTKNSWRGILALYALVLVAFLPTFRAGFIWDDPEHILHNETLRSVHGLVEMWTSFTSLPQWYPLTHTTFWIEYQLWGDSPAGYHIDNLLLHATSCVLLWRIFLMLEVPGALFAACLFAVHPVTVESVAWVTERKNTLSLFFYLLATRAYLTSYPSLRTRGEEPPPNLPLSTGRSVKIYVLALVCFLASILSKSVASTWPAAMLLIVYWQLGKIRLKKDLLPLVPFFIIGALASFNTGRLEREHVIGPLLQSIPELHFTMQQRLMIAGRDLWFYASKIAWPHNLTFIYPRWSSIDASEPINFLFPAAVILAIATLFALRHRMGRGPLALVLFFCGTLVPALGFITVYPMRFSFVADHFQYHAMIGLVVLLAVFITRFIKPRTPVRWSSFHPIESTIIAIFTVLTFIRSSDYASAETIWRDTLAKNPNSWMVYTNLANVLNVLHRDEEAMPLYLKALDLNPGWWETHMNAAGVFRYRGDHDRAIAELREAARLNPNFHEMHFRIATIERQRGHLADAEAEYRAAIHDDPNDMNSRTDLGLMLIDAKRYDDAIATLAEVTQLIPEEPGAWQNLGAAQLRAGHRGEAVEFFRKALRINPNFAPAHGALRSLGEGS